MKSKIPIDPHALHRTASLLGQYGRWLEVHLREIANNAKYQRHKGILQARRREIVRMKQLLDEIDEQLAQTLGGGWREEIEVTHSCGRQNFIKVSTADDDPMTGPRTVCVTEYFLPGDTKRRRSLDCCPACGGIIAGSTFKVRKVATPEEWIPGTIKP